MDVSGSVLSVPSVTVELAFFRFNDNTATPRSSSNSCPKTKPFDKSIFSEYFITISRPIVHDKPEVE